MNRVPRVEPQRPNPIVRSPPILSDHPAILQQPASDPPATVRQRRERRPQPSSATVPKRVQRTETSPNPQPYHSAVHAVQSRILESDLLRSGRLTMSTPARRRLMRDFKRLQEDPPAGVSGAPTDNNIMIWNAVIFGPRDTPFEDGTFKLTLEFTEEYPNKPPNVRFVSKMFHPNV